jgi:hypothetical protein
MDCDTNEPVAHKARDATFETLSENTARLSLEPSELRPGADSVRNSAAGEENVPLRSKDIEQPIGITFGADLESRQSPGLVDGVNIRKESGDDGVESVNNKCSENEGTERKVTEGTEEFHSDIQKAVTDGSVISEKDSPKEYAELNVKEKDECEEVYDKQKKETEEVSDKEKKDPEELSRKKEIEVVNNKEKEIEEISNKQKNEIEVVTDNKTKEIEKVCDKGNSEEKKDKEVLSDKEKAEVEEHSDNEKKSDVSEPENDGGKGKHELEATELLGCENKETTGKKSEGETRMAASRAESSEEREMDVDDPDPYPEHINFVDVNAPNCDSPLVIDDDDDDDEIVMIERRKGTGQKRKTDINKKGKADNSNRDSSPEVVLQEKLCRGRQEIVIDLDDDDDDDDIEIESIKKKKKKKNKSNGPRGDYCCNLECSTPNQDLRSAPVFVLTYYRRKYRKGKAQKVCPLCFEAAMQHQEVCMCMCGIVY